MQIEELLRCVCISLYTTVIYKRVAQNSAIFHKSENICIAYPLMKLQLLQEAPYLVMQMHQTTHCQLSLFDCHEAVHCQNRLLPTKYAHIT